jgi:hypothetical protein
MQPRWLTFIYVTSYLLLGFSQVSAQGNEMNFEETKLSRKIQVLVDTPEEFRAISRDSMPALDVSITSSQEKPKNHQSHTVTVKLDNYTVRLNIHRNGNQISGSRQVDIPFNITQEHTNALDLMTDSLYRISLGNNDDNRKAKPHKHIQLAANMVSILHWVTQ